MSENTKTEFQLLPPSDDGVFKSLMTRPEAEEVLKDLIGSILGCKIIDLRLIPNEIPIDVKGDKQERFDVACKTDKNRLINVEIQADPMRGDSFKTNHISLKKRNVYYLCDLHSTQPGEGIAYALMSNTYQITICGFSIFENDKKLVDKYTMRNEDGRELTDVINCVYVDLTFSSRLAEKQVSEMSPMEMWSVFLAGADKEEYREKIKEISKARKEIGMADTILHTLSMDENEWYHYRMRRKWKLDHDNDIIVATAEGIAIGEVRGEERGIAIGEERGIAIGEERGIAIGEERGIDIGATRKSIEIAVCAIKELKFSITDAIAFVGLAPEYKDALIHELHKQGVAYSEADD